MQCKQCGSDAVRMVDQNGATKEGTFWEKYECQCGATGRIKGKAEQQPRKWQKTGSVFNKP